jgi:hypothetical protein
MPWVIDVITHRDDPPSAPQLTFARLVGLIEDLPAGLRVGDRFGPLTAADRDGEQWHVPLAVVTGITGPLASAASVGPFRRAPVPGAPVAPAAKSGRWPPLTRRDRAWVPSLN